MLRLVGGRADGSIVAIPDPPGDVRHSYLMPVPPDISLAGFAAPDPTRAPSIPVDRYEFRGNIADDGARLFFYVGRF